MLNQLIDHFLQDIQNSLIQNQIIANYFQGAYLSLQVHHLYPFLLINLNKSSNHSTSRIIQCEIDFDICIFYRAKDNQTSLMIAQVDQIIHDLKTLAQKTYTPVGTRQQSTSSCIAKDGITTKFSINYLSFIRAK